MTNISEKNNRIEVDIDWVKRSVTFLENAMSVLITVPLTGRHQPDFSQVGLRTASIFLDGVGVQLTDPTIIQRVSCDNVGVPKLIPK